MLPENAPDSEFTKLWKRIMPRRTRTGTGGFIFHAINRAAGGWRLFDTDHDFTAFLGILEEGLRITPIRILSYTLMPNHWHFVLWPAEDDQLSEYLHWISATHAARWHKAHGTTGRGALYQGRFKSFPVQEDDYYYTLCRYVERNALRANLVQRAEDWRWSSL
jgi:putative transposase